MTRKGKLTAIGVTGPGRARLPAKAMATSRLLPSAPVPPGPVCVPTHLGSAFWSSDAFLVWGGTAWDMPFVRAETFLQANVAWSVPAFRPHTLHLTVVAPDAETFPVSVNVSYQADAFAPPVFLGSVQVSDNTTPVLFEGVFNWEGAPPEHRISALLFNFVPASRVQITCIGFLG